MPRPDHPDPARVAAPPGGPADAAQAGGLPEAEIDDAGDDEDVAPEAGALPAHEAPVIHATVPAQAHGRRLDQWLVSLAPQFSRSHLQQLVEQGCVEIDGRAATVASRKLLAGQRARVVLLPTAQSQAFMPEPMVLPIVFEDEHLIVIDKPAGLVVHPAAGHWRGTLMNGLLAHHAGAAHLPRAGIVHRLDKDTSGVMVVGKTLVACTALTRAIAAREVHRRYRALVWGRPPAHLRIEAPVGRDPVSRVRMAVVASGKPAMTDVALVACHAPAEAGGETARTVVVSAVECTLHTGRTHQIRVHLASRRWPLVADALYGGAPALGMARQALHAARLEFAHPLSGEPLLFEAPLPADMAAAWGEVVHNQATSV